MLAIRYQQHRYSERVKCELMPRRLRECIYEYDQDGVWDVANGFTPKRNASPKTPRTRRVPEISRLLSLSLPLDCLDSSFHPSSWCLREMKLHPDNTVGGVSEPLMARNVDIARPVVRRPFFFFTLVLSFLPSRLRDKFFRRWQPRCVTVVRDKRSCIRTGVSFISASCNRDRCLRLRQKKRKCAINRTLLKSRYPPSGYYGRVGQDTQKDSVCCLI